MADTERSEVGDTPVLTDTAGSNNEITCNYCCKIKLKLEEVLSELSSAEEMIKMVQEEINFSTRNSSTWRGIVEETGVSGARGHNWFHEQERSRKSPLPLLHVPSKRSST